MFRYPALFLAVLFFPLGVTSVHSATPRHQLLATFHAPPRYPVGGLIPDGNGYLWGVCRDGGPLSDGTIFKVKTDGSGWQIVHAFGSAGRKMGSHAYSYPSASLVSDGAGNFWGTTASGGAANSGTIYKVNASSGVVTTVLEFSGVSGSEASLVDDGAGNFWGTTGNGGANSRGTVFKLNRSTCEFTTIVEFGGDNKGAFPVAALVSDGAGTFWGTTMKGGALDHGVIFKLDASSGVMTTVVEFTGDGGANRGADPFAPLVSDGAGFLWGTTSTGGSIGVGTVFKVNVATGAMTTVVDFSVSGPINKGERPVAGMVNDGAGHLWGTTSGGIGTVFKIHVASGLLTTVAEISAETPDRYWPNSVGCLFRHGNGSFWGTTTSGGPYGAGTVFKVDATTGVLTTVVNLLGNGVDHQGSYPNARLEGDGTGVYWSTTGVGGRHNLGTIYKFDERSGVVTTLVEFTGTSGERKGSFPSGLTRVGDEEFWGTTAGGGGMEFGTIFKWHARTGEFTTMVEFDGNVHGAFPNGRLVSDGAGFLWGMTGGGNEDGLGTIFKIEESSGEMTTVLKFTGIVGPNPGRWPTGSLQPDGSGYLWGLTWAGGSSGSYPGNGTVFKVNAASGELTTVVEFSGVAGANVGSSPLDLISAGAGSFIGTMGHGFGAIFRVDAGTGQLTTLHQFTQPPSSQFGYYPGGLVKDGAGSIWGHTGSGGENGHGTVFKFDPATGQLTTFVHFTGDGDLQHSGAQPDGTLVLHPDGDVYGTTANGGPGGGGTIFRIRGATQRPFAQVISHRAGSRGTGSAVPGEPEGTSFVSAGEPAVDRQTAAFLATIRKPDGKQASAVFGGNAIVARAGETAPGAEPAAFKTFDEPLVSSAGIAFGAKLSDGRSGIWTTAFTGELQLVEINKSAAPGVPDSKVASIMSYSLRGEEIVALLKLQRGPGGVTGANDTTLTRYGNGNESRLLSKGQGIFVGEANPQPLLSLSAFTPSPLAPGQDRGHAEGVVGAKGTVRLTDRSVREVVLKARGDGAVEVVEMSSPAVRTATEFLAKRFGLPAVGGADGLAYTATAHARAAAQDQAIATDLVESESDDQPLEILEGDQPAPGAEPATFLSMSDPVVNDQRRVAFLAGLQGEGVTAKNNRGLWWGDAAGLSLVARLGGFAPDRGGAPSAAAFAKIERFGLPDAWDAGPLFIAALTGPRGSNVTSANNRALYGCDSDGKVRELLRTGDELEHAGEVKKVRSFTALSGGKPIGGRRAFTTAGHVAARVMFTDKSTGIIQITVP